MYLARCSAIVLVVLAGCTPSPAPPSAGPQADVLPSPTATPETASQPSTPGDSIATEKPSAVKTSETRKAEGEGFSFELPAGWDNKTEMGVWIAFPNQAPYPVTITVQRQAVPDSSTPEQALASLKMSAAAKTWPESKIYLAGIPAFRMVGAADEADDSPPASLHYGLLLENTHVIAINCRVNDPADFATYEPQIDRIVGTLSIP
jgi:hypothetical protein